MVNLFYKTQWNTSTKLDDLIEERQRQVQFLHDLDIEIGLDSHNWSYCEINEAVAKRERYKQQHSYIDTLILQLEPSPR